MKKIKSHNPKGYNKHMKNPEPKKDAPKVKPTLDEVQNAYREMWRAKRNYLSKAQIYSEKNRLFMDIDRLREEAEKDVMTDADFYTK